MIWSSFLRWLRATSAPARREILRSQLAVELLEDRTVPSTINDALAHKIWAAKTFKVDDIKVVNLKPPVSGPSAMATTVPQNASFGSMIGLPSVFSNYSYRGAGYSVAVIDTGIDYTHADLGGGFGIGKRVIAGWDFVNNDANPMDDNGHGTHVAGIIGSSDATYSGVAPDVNLIALKVLDKSGSGSYGSVEKALQWVIANQSKYNIVAINLSLGSGNYTSNPYTFLDDEFSTLRNKGVFLAVAAGNSFYSYSKSPGISYPGVNPYVVSVGAVYDGNFGNVAWGSGARDYTTAVDRVASFSQRSSSLSIMAPGAMITSTYLNNTNQTMAGTSMATPVVAGAAVLLHQAMDARGLTANQTTILSAMKNTGVTIVDGDDENDNVTNTGLSFKRLYLSAALDSLGKPANTAPTLQPIANQSIVPGGSRIVTFNASDAEGNPITFTASITSAPNSLAYQLDQQLGLVYAGSYYTNQWGQNEKWMTSTDNTWYCILPNGQLRRWAGSMTTTMQVGNLVATLSTDHYADPKLLWDAQPPAGPTLTINGNQLTIATSPTTTLGNYQILVTASDGTLSSTKSFTLTLQGNTAPKITTIAGQSMSTNRSKTVTVNGTDAEGNVLTYSAALVGTFTAAPASLVMNGNQLTIHSSPNFVGAFDVRVTVSDGKLSSSTTFRVTVAASSVFARFSADANGDGRPDTIFFNNDGYTWVSLAQAGGTFVNQQWSKWSGSSAWKTIQIGDFNGDGKADIAGFYTGGGWYVGLSTGSSFTTSLWATWPAASNFATLKVGDFNGDGKTDVLGFALNGDVTVGVSNGSTFTSSKWVHWSGASNWSKFKIADVDDDGKMDLVACYTATKQWYVGYSTGVGFRNELWTGSGAPSGNVEQF